MGKRYKNSLMMKKDIITYHVIDDSGHIHYSGTDKKTALLVKAANLKTLASPQSSVTIKKSRESTIIEPQSRGSSPGNKKD